MRLTFYSALDVFLALTPHDARLPANLATELMKRGIRTIFTLGDKTYEFNRDDDT